MKLGHVIIAVAILSLLFVGGCGRSATPTEEPEAPTDPMVLRIGLNAEPDNLDPHLLVQTESMRVMEQMYSSLLRLSATLEIQPDVAEEWSVNDEGTVFTFKLREDVYFHNGRQVTADDVKFSIERVVDPDVGSPWSYLFGDLDTVAVVDEFTVEIVMKEAAAHVLAALATPFVSIIPEEATADEGLRTQGVGTGPFKFVEWVPGQHIVLEKNADYHHEGLPLLDELRWVFVEDPTSRVQQVMSGTVDLDIDAPLESITAYRGDDNIEVLGGEVVSYYLLGINSAREPFDDVRVRQALAWAVDREEIVDVAARGFGSPLFGGPLPSNHWAYSGVEIYTAPDAERAKELLAEAGYPDGITLELLTRPGEEGIAQVVEQQLAAAGITATINRVEAGAFNQRVWTEGDFDVVCSRWGTMIDPDDFFIHFQTDGGWNPYGFGHPGIDDLILQGRRVMDQDERKTIYGELEALVAEQVPYVFLYRPERFAAFGDSVEGLQHEAANTRLSLRETKVSR